MCPVLAIVGPTGSGKSDLGLRIAKEFRGEIINCDSIQVYAGLDIGSAKTPMEQRCGIRHHLLDVIAPEQELTAGAYARLARVALQQIADRGNLPVIVGGTGLYLRAFLEGLSPAPARNERLRERLRAKNALNSKLLHRFLRRYDPAAAARIHANDQQKLIRAVELAIASRQSLVGHRPPRDALSGIRILKIGLNPERKLLYERLNQRAGTMFTNGLVAEAAHLLGGSLLSEAKPLQSLGYKQAVQLLAGAISERDAIEECQRKTRQYAKRQLTWFRHDPAVQWLQGFGTDPAIQAEAVGQCGEFLGR